MNADARHAAIVAALHQRGRVNVNELAEAHGVTVETIRRDLTALDQAGALRKVHGGAVPAVSPAPESAADEREHTNAAAKLAIANAALKALELKTGATLLLDAGSSVAALARLLPEDQDLTVITNSVLIAAEAATHQGVRVHILGGQVRGITQAAVGAQTVATLSRLRADVAVLGANGLSLNHGLSTPEQEEAAVKMAITAAGRKVVALVDATKFGQEHLVSFARLDDVDLLVTDANPPEPLRQQLASTGCEVLQA
ncbi:DeoR/GlpR family DNA-binding transcription regulator [Actinomyces trachealis]|uniref:DeoR/GlpR family DNA-binding transcription regulator n=1 Tax=Actinomyces trachealis TaxID=2763540 RepID=UPI001892B610|nr:DeoR/GlpR family DNA-binding transcription regulator [Actinomyces trachealis]